MTPKLNCPICGRAFAMAASSAMPFCSERCRQIDLGRWLREHYSVPVEDSDAEEEEGMDRDSQD